MRGYDLNKSYGIGISDYDKILLDQGGKCAVCGKTAEEKKINAKKLKIL